MTKQIKFDFSQYDVGGINASAKDGKLTGEERIIAENDGWNVWERYTERDANNYGRDGKPGRHESNYTGTIEDGWDRLTYNNGVLTHRYSNNNDGLKYRDKLGVLCNSSNAYFNEYGINISYEYDNQHQVITEKHKFGYDSYMVNPQSGKVVKHDGLDNEVDKYRSNFTETFYPNGKLKQYKDNFGTVDVLPYKDGHYKITVSISGETAIFSFKDGDLKFQEKSFLIFGPSVKTFENKARAVISKLDGQTNQLVCQALPDNN